MVRLLINGTAFVNLYNNFWPSGRGVLPTPIEPPSQQQQAYNSTMVMSYVWDELK